MTIITMVKKGTGCLFDYVGNSYNNNNIYKVQYPMYIEIQVQWTIHTMGGKFK